MNKKELQTEITKMVDELLDKNTSLIQEELFANVESTDSEQVIYARMILNSIRLSTQFSVQIAMDMLQNIEVFDASEVKIIAKLDTINGGKKQ